MFDLVSSLYKNLSWNPQKSLRLLTSIKAQAFKAKITFLICDEILMLTESNVMTDVDRKRVWRHQSKYSRNSPNLSAQLLAEGLLDLQGCKRVFRKKVNRRSEGSSDVIVTIIICTRTK